MQWDVLIHLNFNLVFSMFELTLFIKLSIEGITIADLQFEKGKKCLYLKLHSTHVIYGYVASDFGLDPLR